MSATHAIDSTTASGPRSTRPSKLGWNPRNWRYHRRATRSLGSGSLTARSLVGLGLEIKKAKDRLRQWDGSALPPGLRKCLLRELDRREVAARQIGELKTQRRKQIREEDDPEMDQGGPTEPDEGFEDSSDQLSRRTASLT